VVDEPTSETTRLGGALSLARAGRRNGYINGRGCPVAQKKEGLPCIWGRKELCVRAESLSALCSRAPSSLAPPYVSLIKTRSRHHTRKGCYSRRGGVGFSTWRSHSLRHPSANSDVCQDIQIKPSHLATWDRLLFPDSIFVYSY
jgi:hypothetical protein